MATATADVPRGTIPPTEAEIREALRIRAEDYPGDDPRKPLLEAIESFAQVLTSPAWDALESPDPRDGPRDPEPDDLWADLRPSEARDLRRLAGEAIAEAQHDAELLIRRKLEAAGLRFVELHPNAPRAKVGPVA